MAHNKNKLFSDNFAIVSTNEELQLLQNQHPNYDPAYVCQSALLQRQDIKDWIESLWELYKPYAEPSFWQEFKHQFAQRAWELYLGVTLLNNGFELKKQIINAPDFSVVKDDTTLAWIEATAANKGSSNDKVPDMMLGAVIDVPEEKMLLRLTNALNTKKDKFENYLKQGTVSKNEPCVIAINRSQLGHVDPPIPLILKALFPIGHQTLHIMVHGKRQKNPELSWSYRPEVAKKNDEKVPMNFFQNPDNQIISAIIYCEDNILNSPKSPEKMGENFTIVHNPLAKNRLPKNFLNLGTTYVVQDGKIINVTNYPL